MKKEYRYCQHIHDNGDHCGSAALTGRDYCRYHLRYRGRLMRMAQARARNQPFDLILPPLENMHAVQSALTKVVEAVAADMIDLKHARIILTALRQAAQNLKVEWRDSAYHNEEGGTYEEFESEFGLPENLDLNAPPEVAFPPPPEPSFSDLSSRAEAAASAAGVEGPAFSDTAAGSPSAAKDGDLEFSPDFPISAENVEVCEIYQTQGPDAAQVRCGQLERNRHRRELRIDRKRYADIALRRNIRIAAEKLALRKLAGQQAQAELAAKKPPASATTDTDEYLARKEEATA